MYRLPKEFENPVLVACTDGVGTKVALAQEFGSLNGIGQDLVAMCVNDLLFVAQNHYFFWIIMQLQSFMLMKHLL